MECTKRGRHVDVNYHNVRKGYLRSNIKPGHMDSNGKLAELLTKMLPKTNFDRLTKLVFDENC